VARPASDAASETASTTLSAFAFAMWLLVYVLLSWLGLYFDDGSGLVSVLWPAAGVAAALVLHYGLKALWVPMIGQLLALQIAGYVWDMPWFASIGGGVGSAFANAGATWLVYRLFEGQHPVRLHDSYTFLKFAMVVAPLASVFSALVGIATLLAFSRSSELDSLTRITLWWSGDMVGYLLVTPVLLTWSERKLNVSAMFEFCSLILLAAGFLALLLIADVLSFAGRILLAPFGLVLLFWALVRLRLFYLNLLLLITGLTFVLVHREGGGPFQLGEPVLSHLALQAFLVALTVGTVAIATLLRERRRLNHELVATNQSLEVQVRERTERLE
jgi:two-component system, NtrC family, sensor kinase